jgi:hypothetical protein
MQPETQNPAGILPESAGARVTIDYKRRNLDMIPVMRQELTNIGSASAQSSLYFTLLGIAIGILATAIASLASGEIQNVYFFAAFVSALIVSALGTICFGVLGWMAWGRYKVQIKTIEDECAERERSLTYGSAAPAS